MEINRILVTGAGGFIGAHFIDAALKSGIVEIVCLDSFRHKGTYSRFNDIPNIDLFLCKGLVKVFHHDLTAPIDEVLANRLGVFDAIFNFASNSAVERSMTNPYECWRNNCELILNMLEYVRSYQGELKAFFQISTDEVYGDYKGDGDGYPEWAPINPSNPYAASKAAQEALCIAYWRSYNIPIVICNTMNNVGEWQDPEKFIPAIIRRLANDEEILIYTDNEGNIGSRVYLDTKDHARFLLQLATHWPRKYDNGLHDCLDRYNIAGVEEHNNLSMARMVAEVFGKEWRFKLVPAKSVRPGYDKRYRLDPHKLEAKILQKHTPIRQTIERIVAHAKANPWWL